MATIASQARRLADALTRISNAVIVIADRVGVEAKEMPRNRDKDAERFLQMETIADILESIVAASSPSAPVETEEESTDVPEATDEAEPVQKRGRKKKAD